jgi:flagellar hook-associated protein 1 FlgK
MTFNGYYRSTAASIGSQADQANQNLKAQQLLDDQLQAHRAEVSGVSMDQELINMMQYQRAFEAASRIVTTADTLMQTILSLKQ